MRRKSPMGPELEEFVRRWHLADHQGKIDLANEYEMTYGTAKHVISDGGYSKPAPTGQLSMDELMNTRLGINLDFVSFDIESSGLEADFSFLLSAVIKPFGREPIVFRADNYPTWERHRADDSMIVKDIGDELRRHAIVITHYGARFDIPYMRAKMVKHGIPLLPPMFGIDSWRIAKDNFKLASRRLKALSNFFDIGDKDPVEGALWMQAAFNGSREAMDLVVEHNIKDCIVLERLAALTFPFIKSIPKL